MPNVPDQTESLVSRTKNLLAQRGDLSLREVAKGAGVGYEWLRKFAYDLIEEPSANRIERLHNYLADYQAAQRFKRDAETRASQ